MIDRNDNEPNKRAAEAGRKATDEATRTARAATDEAAEAGHQTVRASTDIARQTAETTQEAFRSGLDATTQSVRQVADQFTQVLGFAGPQSEELARTSSQNVEAVMQASTVVVQGLQEISREWIGLAQDRFTKNLDGLNELARCRSVPDLIATQSNLVRDNLQQMIDNSRHIAQISVRVADDAARLIQAQANTNADRSRGRAYELTPRSH